MLNCPRAVKFWSKGGDGQLYLVHWIEFTDGQTFDAYCYVKRHQTYVLRDAEFAEYYPPTKTVWNQFAKRVRGVVRSYSTNRICVIVCRPRAKNVSCLTDFT